MGVKNLWDILESCKQTLPLHHLQNKRLCVDLSCWMVQFQSAIKTHNCVKEKLYLRSLFHRVRALIALNCSLIFVTDGSIPAIKLSAYRRRLGSALEVIEGETNSQTVKSLRRNTGSEFSSMIREAKVLGIALGIPCLDGLEEAEAQCASLNSASLCDGCFSSDSDIFLFGARTVYRDILLGEGGYVTCYEMVDIERKLGFGRNSLITLALLLGSDYSQGVHGFGPETACRIVKSIGDETILHQIVSEGLVITRKTRGTKKTRKVLDSDANKENDSLYKHNIDDNRKNPGPDDQFLQVINAYMKPKCLSPDSEAVQRVCTQHPFQRVQLQQICERAFGWSHNQTDQYILPKVAERDLRRFANLRTTSSELGVRLPLHKIPVPCPVFAIVKQRKVKGRECFEVSWHEVDGLQTSVVPADLVESACPEKIAEFMEKKAEGKKQNRKPRARKSTKAVVSEVDLQLQGLMLSIESESNGLENSKCHHATGISNLQSNTIHDMGKHHPNISLTKFQNNVFLDTSKCHQNTSLSIESPSNLFLNTSKYHQNTSPHTELQRNVLLDAAGQYRSAAPKNVEPEVIDLSTPSPPLRKCKVITNESALNRDVNVIDLSDSETDASPKHEQKARELRLFIDSIKEDLH